MANGHKGGKQSRRPLEVDWGPVLKWLLIGAFALIIATVGYGFATRTLSPTVVLPVAATLFSGVLAGVLAGGKSKKEPPARADPPPESDGDA